MLNFTVISRIPATSNLEFFVMSVDDWKSLNNFTKRLIEDVMGVPESYLNLQRIFPYI